MDVHSFEIDNKTIRYIELPESNILFNTQDVSSALGRDSKDVSNYSSINLHELLGQVLDNEVLCIGIRSTFNNYNQTTPIWANLLPDWSNLK